MKSSIRMRGRWFEEGKTKRGGRLVKKSITEKWYYAQERQQFPDLNKGTGLQYGLTILLDKTPVTEPCHAYKLADFNFNTKYRCALYMTARE